MRYACLAVVLFASSPAAAQQDQTYSILESMESAITGAINGAGQSVVAIARVEKDRGKNVANSLNFNLPGLGKPLIDPTSPGFVPSAFGTGVIISKDGDVLTTYHVLDDPEANDYYIWHHGVGFEAEVRAAPAEVQAGDPWTDMAVLRFKGTNLKPIRFGDAKALKQGTFVIALGNPYAIARDGRASASLGIVANLQRALIGRQPLPSQATPTPKDQLHQYGTLIQTDAKLNLGTSGGALINLKGEMVGLTTALASVAGYDEAAGFAIPIDAAAKSTIEQLRQGRTPAFGFLGLEPTDVPHDARIRGVRGAVVRQVLRGMPASQAGIRSGDLITEVDGEAIDDAVGLFREMSRRPAHAKVVLTVVSGDADPGTQPRSVRVSLGKKYLALGKPGYSRIPEPTWRGMMVDHGSALPPAAMFGFSRPGQILPVCITRVDPDTPAWIAGLRPGQFIERIAGKEATDPEMFYQTVAKIDGPVEVTIIGSGNRSERLTVLPSVASSTTDR